MFFNETQSCNNVIFLLYTCFFLKQNMRLIIALIYLATKNIVQGFLCRNDISKYLICHSRMYIYKKTKENITILYWIQINFQPLFVNIFLSSFDKNKKIFWNIIFIMCVMYGFILTISLKHVFFCDYFIDNHLDESLLEKYCTECKLKKNNRSGKINQLFYIGLMCIPGLITKAIIITGTWILFVLFLHFIFNNVKSEEFSELLCLLSVVYVIPISLYGSTLQ